MDQAVQHAGATDVTVTRIGPYFGAEISGVDLRAPLSQQQAVAIRAALLEYEVLVFRDQDITPEQQLAFGRNFGDLSVHPIAPHDADIPELIVFDNNESNPAVNTDNWHSDETFREVPPLGTVLRALVVPPLGGNTLFASMTAAYDGLADWVKTAVEEMDAVHDLKLHRGKVPETEEERAKDLALSAEFPPAVHPIVRIHPETGKRVLFVNPHFTIGIKGLPEIESQALLSVLYHQAQVPEYQLRIEWEPNTIVFWDNRSTQHYAPHDYSQRRHLHRITVIGDRPFGPTSPRAKEF